MLCKIHTVEECNSSDCESCGLETKIKQLEAVLKKVTQLISRKIDDGCTYSYGFALKDLLNELKALESKE